MGVSIPIALH